jgi:hypothetical protein
MSSEYEMEQLIEQSNQKKNDVVRMTAEGRGIAEIKQQTSLTTKEIREINEDFKRMARSSDYVAQRGKEIIGYSDVHWTSIIERYNDLYDNSFDDKTKADILNKIVVAEKARIDFLQKAGILNDQGIGAEIAEREARERQLMDILKRAKHRYPEAMQWVFNELAKADDIVPQARGELN